MNNKHRRTNFTHAPSILGYANPHGEACCSLADVGVLPVLIALLPGITASNELARRKWAVGGGDEGALDLALYSTDAKRALGRHNRLGRGERNRLLRCRLRRVFVPRHGL
jgi:hypothetical protein